MPRFNIIVFKIQSAQNLSIFAHLFTGLQFPGERLFDLRETPTRIYSMHRAKTQQDVLTRCNQIQGLGKFLESSCRI
jgi:hypothetical protein